ncbi:hypothetical protein B0H14DRAFT_3500893 [Mycena olivaceomarginata]|nr:hypothetical protein B0H14DRAFT_3500893 [Mycena olivaceomarginata]
MSATAPFYSPYAPPPPCPTLRPCALSSDQHCPPYTACPALHLCPMRLRAAPPSRFPCPPPSMARHTPQRPCRLLCELVHTTTALFHAATLLAPTPTSPLFTASTPPPPALLPQSLVSRLGAHAAPSARSFTLLRSSTPPPCSLPLRVQPPPMLNAAAVPMPHPRHCHAYRARATHPATALVYTAPPPPSALLTAPIRALIQVDTALCPPSHLFDPPPSTLPSLIHSLYLDHFVNVGNDLLLTQIIQSSTVLPG